MSRLTDFLNQQLIERGWSKSELARRAGVSTTQTTDVLNQRANPGADFCIAIARALGEPPERLLRLAGILPQLPPAVAEEREALDLFRRLSSELRRAIMDTMRSLRGIRTAPHILREDRGEYNAQPQSLRERLARELERELATMPQSDLAELERFMQRQKERRETGPIDARKEHT